MAARGWAKRYAQAIFEIAMLQDPANAEASLDTWVQELRSMSEALENEDFRVFLQHAKVPLERKVKAIREVLPGLSSLARNLLSLMVSRGLVDSLVRVREEYLGLVDRHRGLERVKVYSAVPLVDQEKERISRFVHEMIGRQVVLEAEVDPSVLGGLVIRVGDRLLDGSAKSKLESLQQELETVPMVAGT